MPAEEFSAWYRTLWPPVLRAVTVTVGDRDLAEEAVAEAFARALARWPGPTEFDSPAAWLHRVAVNEVRSRWRRNRLERRVLQRVVSKARHQLGAVLAPTRPDLAAGLSGEKPHREEAT